MKLTVSKTELLRAIEVAGRAFDPKSPQPIYAALMLEVADGSLRLTGTDGELTLTAGCLLADEKAEEGKVAVIGETFVSIVKRLPGPLVEIIGEKTALMVRSQKSRYRVPILTGEAWPVVPHVEPLGRFTVNERAFGAQLSRVLPAVATDISRPTICGVCIKVDPGRLHLVATDTHRLHVAQIGADTLGVGSMILGSGPAKELAKLLQADEPCEAIYDAGALQVTGSWGTFVSTLIHGNYVAYERFIPTAGDYAAFDQTALADAVKRAAYVAQGCADRLVVTLTDRDVAVLEAVSEQYGDAEEELSITAGGLGPQEFAVSARNLGAAVAGVPDEEVRLYRSAAQRGILIAGADTTSYFAVVIPMRLPSDA